MQLPLFIDIGFNNIENMFIYGTSLQGFRNVVRLGYLRKLLIFIVQKTKSQTLNGSGVTVIAEPLEVAT